MGHYRIQKTLEDAGERGWCIVPNTEDGERWWCDHCGQLNDPRQHGGDWPTCVNCGRFRDDDQHLRPDHEPSWEREDAT